MSFWARIRDIGGRLDGLSYYQVLDVPPDAGGEDITRRYYELAERLHPDRHARGAQREDLAVLTRLHARLGEARRVLTSPGLRADYDARLAQGERRVGPDDGRRKPSAARTLPAHPMARQLYDQAQAMLARGDLGRARTTLGLARQYEPASAAIAEALAQIEIATAPPSAPERPGEASARADLAGPPAPSPAPAPARSPTPAPSLSPTPSQAPPPDPSPAPLAAEDSRVHPRKPVAVPIKLRLPTWRHVELLVTRDLSRGGTFLRSTRPLEVGARLELALEVPTGATVTLPAEVVRAVAPGGDAPPGMGLRFLDVPVEALVLLDQLLSQHRDAPG